MPDDPTLWDLQRQIERNHQETSADFADMRSQNARDIQGIADRMERYVLREVFEARELATVAREQAALARIARLEAAHTDQARENVARARGSRAAYYAAAGAMLAAIVGAVMAYLLARGGHG